MANRVIANRVALSRRPTSCVILSVPIYPVPPTRLFSLMCGSLVLGLRPRLTHSWARPEAPSVFFACSIPWHALSCLAKPCACLQSDRRTTLKNPRLQLQMPANMQATQSPLSTQLSDRNTEITPYSPMFSPRVAIVIYSIFAHEVRLLSHWLRLSRVVSAALPSEHHPRQFC